MRRARHQCGDEARYLISEANPAPDPKWGVGTDPEVRLAIGSQEFDRLAVEVLDDEAAVLELATITHAVFVIDADGVVEDVNSLAETLVGYPRGELLGQRINFIATDITLPTRQVRSFSACMHHRIGQEITVDVVLCPHGGTSTIAFMTARPQDHARRTSEVAQIVHDLKNPLATIALEMGLLEHKLVQSDLKTVVTRVSRNVAFLDRMVQDLLDVGSMEVDCFHVHRAPCDIYQLIEHVLERSIATRDRARVEFHAHETATLELDELRIERVVANLVANALKYSPSRSRVVIRLDVHESVVRVSVTDQGPGIRPDEASFIFDKYRRASSADGHEGNGLGLYVSKRIVEAHRGQIGVISEVAVGSCFFFELPRTT